MYKQSDKYLSQITNEELSFQGSQGHYCLFYENQQERQDVVVPFLVSGIKQNDKCIYVLDHDDTAAIVDNLSKSGIDYDELMQTGQLTILEENAVYTKESLFNPDLLIQRLILETEEARAQDYNALRITGNASWALNHSGNIAKLMEYEIKLHKALFSKYPCMALCQYDLNLFDPVDIKSAVFTHPFIIRKGNVYRNFYYIEPESYMIRDNQIRHEVDCIFENLEKERLFQETLINNEREYSRLFETMNQGVIYQDADGAIVSANPAAEEILGLTLSQMQGKTSMDPRWQMVKEDGTKISGADHPSMVALRTGKKIGPVTRGVFHAEKNKHIWLNITAIPLFQPGETKPFQVYATIEDITEQKLMEEKLRKNELLMRTILDNLPIGVAVNTVNPIADPEYMNDNFPRIYHTTREAISRPDSFWEAVYEDAEFRKEIKKRVLDDCASGDPNRMIWENIPIKRKNQDPFYVTAMNIPFPDGELMLSTVMDVTKQNVQDQELRRIQWMLDADKAKKIKKAAFDLKPSAPSRTELNQSGIIQDAVGAELLTDIAFDYLSLLETSTSVYEKNGDYALELFSSGWCKLLNCASRKMCQTEDSQTALNSGKWLCHESCWTNCSRIAIESGKPVDIPCHGGLRIYAVPIRAKNQVIGAINVGYGNPPKEKSTLIELSEKYNVDIDDLERQADAYETRPPYIIELAKDRLHSSARLIGILVEHKMMENEMNTALSRVEAFMENSPGLVMMFDENGNYIEVSASVASLFGLSREALRGKNFKQLLPSETATKFMQSISQLKNDGHTIELIDQLVLDGEERVIESRLFPVKSDEDTAALFGSIAVDVTERKRTEAYIQQHLREISLVLKISSSLRTADSLEAALTILLNETMQVLNAADGAIYLYNPASGSLDFFAAHGWLDQQDDSILKLGESLTRRPGDQNELYVSKQYATDLKLEHRDQVPSGWGGVFVPLLSDRDVVGMLNVSVPVPREINDSEQRLLRALAEMAGSALHRLKLYDETSERLQQLQSLRTIDQAITGSLDLRLTLNVVLEQVTTQLDVDAACIFLFQPHLKILEYVAGKGFKTKILKNKRLRLGETCAGKAALSKEMFLVVKPDKHDDQCSQILEAEGFSACIAIPLTVRGDIIGVLEVFRITDRSPESEWLDFLEIMAGQASIAIDSARLFDRIQRANQDLIIAYDATIEGWAKALELRDYETEGHSRRVSELTVYLAREMGIAENHLSNVYRGTLLHDVGKMGISDHILLKPGKLSEDEWDIMKRHPEFAFDMLSSIDYLRPSLEIPYCHHEKWDGSGYPRGLKEHSIPLEARIFAVVDVFDALTSDRPYRDAWSKDKALDYIKEQSGKHFDPKVVEAFLQEVADQ